MNKHLILRAISQKRAAADKILAACQVGNEVREMSKEECEQFDALMSEVKGLKEQLARVEQNAKGDDEAEPAEAAGRSTRASDPNQFNGQSPGIHTRKRPYSLLRALRFACDSAKPDGLEGEVSTEVRRRNPGKSYRGQFSMPIDPDADLRALMYPNSERRDLTTSTGAGGIFTVPEMPMIELLRPRMVVHSLGATFLTGMQGNFAIPRQSGKSTVNWIGEGNSSTPSNATLDNVPFTPKVAVDLTNISREFINQTSVSAETFAMNDLAKSMAVEWDRVSINGLGSGSNQPLGVFQNTSIQALSTGLALGTNGGALTWGSVVNMETQVSNLNADQGKLRYLTCPAIRGTLKQVPKGTSSTFPIFIWEKGKEPGVGEVNSYEAWATTLVPSNLTKGSGTNLGAIAYGNWEDLVVASWDDGIDFLVNPYSGQASAAIAISMQMSVDSEVRHAESFAIITDATYNAF